MLPWPNRESPVGIDFMAATIDATAKLYVERCEHLMKAPPPPDWGGVWVMESK